MIQGGDYSALNARRISEETCRKWGYQVATYKGKPVQVANYRDKDGNVIAQKVRTPDKDFCILGNAKEMGLYGKWLWRTDARMVVVTEGEVDAMSVAEAQGNKWPVVSIPNGAQAAAKSIRKDIEWLEGFDRVVFFFDSDEPGRKACRECAEMLPPGKAYIYESTLKDANEMLKAGLAKELAAVGWDAKPYRPDGIISGDDLTVDELLSKPSDGYTTPYPGINDLNRGVRKGELTLFTAGTGVGKTTIVREIGHHHVTRHDLKIGNIFLEENFRKTALGYIAIDQNIPIGVLRENPEAISREQYEKCLNRIVRGKQHFYNHFGSMESESLIAKLRYFSVGLQCDFILLDHISMVVSGQEGSGQGERKDIDILMTALRSLIENTGVGIIAVVHLKQPEGKPHEEGGRVTLSQLRGSGTLKQVPDSIIALERDQQGDTSNIALIRQLKNREWGSTGDAGYVKYHSDTGRLLPCDPPEASADTFFDNTPTKPASNGSDPSDAVSHW